MGYRVWQFVENVQKYIINKNDKTPVILLTITIAVIMRTTKELFIIIISQHLRCLTFHSSPTYSLYIPRVR